MPRFGVNITRTITVDQTVYVNSKNKAAAAEKVRDLADAGKCGEPHVEFKGAKGFASDAEGSEITEDIVVEDAWLDE